MTDFDSELNNVEKTATLVGNAKWAKFENIGDSYQGTYVHRYEAKAPSGQDQIVYVLKTDEGAVNIGRNVRDIRVHRVMNEARYGQVVRFKHTEIVKNPNKALNDIKVVEAITRPDIVDKDWLKEQGVTETIDPGIMPSEANAASDIMNATGSASHPSIEA